MYAPSAAVWFAFFAYLAATFFFAWAGRRKAAKGAFLEEFFVGGRTIGPWVLGLTWIATSASGGSFIGTPGLVHTYGWTLLLWISGYIVVATVGFGLLGQRVAQVGRATGALTFPDLLRDRFDSKPIGLISAAAIVILYTSYMTAQYVAGARVIEAVLGVPYVWGAIGFAAVVGLYTAWGGFRAVAWTDAFQALVMLFGVLLAAAFALHKVGGWEAVSANLAQQDPRLLTPPGPDNFLPIPAAISFFVIWPFAAVGQPSLVTRFLASRDLAGLQRAALLVGLYILLLYPAIIALGVMGRVLNPGLAAPDHAMPAAILAATPPWLAGFILAAPMAAIMSTLSSFLLVSSAAVVRDLYERNRAEPLPEKAAMRLTHAATFLVAIAALAFALKPPPFLQYIVVFSGTGLASTFLAPMFFGLYWPRMNRSGCLAGMLCGFASFIAQYAAFGTKSVFGFDPFVWALLISVAGCVAGSLAQPPDAPETLERYFGEADS